MSKQIIGTFEQVAFPEFNAAHVRAKIDTGAYTGALHCSSIEERDVEGGTMLCFVPYGSEEIIQKDNFITKHVKSSNGKREKRYFVITEIIVRGISYEIMISLANRSEMRWPVLIGRRFLRHNNFLVDPNHANGYGEQTTRD